jgi:hypothetical protein
MENRESLANPEKGFGEVTKELADKWNKLKGSNTPEYKKYLVLEEASKRAYDEAMREYTPPSYEELLEMNKKEKKSRVKVSKLVRTAFDLFSIDKKEELKDRFDSDSELTKEVKRLWDEIVSEDSSEFHLYEEQAKKLLEAKEAEASVLKEKLADPNAPKRPKKAYNLFLESEKNSDTNKGRDKKEVAKELSKAWKEMKEANTDEYKKYVTSATKKMDKWKTLINKFEPTPKKSVSESSSSSE